jgi:hypothetical protein
MLRAVFGRTTEVTEMSWDEVCWDPYAQVATVSIVEMKTSKTKSSPYPTSKHVWIVCTSRLGIDSRPVMTIEVFMMSSLRMRVCSQL